MVGAESLRAHAAAGVTTVRDLGDRGYRTLAFRMCPDTPRSASSATDARTSPATAPPRKWQWPPGVVTGGPDATTRANVGVRADRAARTLWVNALYVKVRGWLRRREPARGHHLQFTVPDLVVLVDGAHQAGLPVRSDCVHTSTFPGPTHGRHHPDGRPASTGSSISPASRRRAARRSTTTCWIRLATRSGS
jgi:hypothetical protein